MATITIKKEMNFDELYRNSWSGAIPTLNEVIKHNKEDELMEFISMLYMDTDIPTDTEINDLLWFDDNYIFENIGITNPYTSDDDEEEDSE